MAENCGILSFTQRRRGNWPRRPTSIMAKQEKSVELEGTIHDIAKTVHPHPTLSEIVMEAAHGAVDQPIHMIKR